MAKDEKKWSGDRLTALEAARRAEAAKNVKPGAPMPKASTQPVKAGVIRTGDGGLIG